MNKKKETQPKGTTKQEVSELVLIMRNRLFSQMFKLQLLEDLEGEKIRAAKSKIVISICNKLCQSFARTTLIQKRSYTKTPFWCATPNKADYVTKLRFV